MSKELRLVAGRDAENRDLVELKGYSSTVVRQAFADGKPIVVTGTDEGRALGSESAVLHNLRSIMAVPLKVRDKNLGVVYLDSRLAKGLFTSGDLDLLSAISNHIAIAFETSRMANVEAERRAMERDLELTAAVQSLFLPKQKTFQVGPLSLAGHYQAASQASGDWWWYSTDTEGGLSVLVGDVTGHGPASAMLTASTATYMKSLLDRGGNTSMKDILTQLNSGFNSFAQGEFNMTMSATCFDLKEMKLQWWNAGAPSVMIMTKNGTLKILSAPGSPLGSEKFELGSRQHKVEPGDRILLFTDGAPELEMPGGKQLRLTGFRDIFLSTRKAGLQEALDSVIAKLAQVRGDVPLQDDFTLVMIDCAA